MIDIPERIFRMFLMKDDEPCLCMSGKPFKLCHKLLIEGGSEDRRKLLAELLKVKKRKECLFGYKSDCSDKIVKAHSISKLHLRWIADEDNHVYSFLKISKNMRKMSSLFKEGFLPDPEKIGWNDVTVFPGLCENHDNDLFASFEKNDFMYELNQIAALHLRPILKEIHVKTEAIMATSRGQKIIGKVSRGFNVIQKNAFSLITALGNNLSLRDLFSELKLIRDYVIGNSSEKLLYLCFEIKGDCPLLCSSTINPAYNLYGDRIQEYNDENTFTRSFSFNVIAKQGRYWFLFSWFESKEIESFFHSLCDRMEGHVLSWLVQMVFAFSENSAFNIAWFDSLSLIKKQRLKRLFFSDLLNLDSGRSTCAEFRNLNFAEGEIAKITTNAEAFAKIDVKR